VKAENTSNVIQFPKQKIVVKSSDQDAKTTNNIKNPLNNSFIAEQRYENNKIEASDYHCLYLGEERFILEFNEKPYSVIDLLQQSKLLFQEKRLANKILHYADTFLQENPELREKFYEKFQIEIKPDSFGKEFAWEVNEVSASIRRLYFTDIASGSAKSQEQALKKSKSGLNRMVINAAALEIIQPASIRITSNLGEIVDIYIDVAEGYSRGSFKYQASWKQKGSKDNYLNHDYYTYKPGQLLEQTVKKINEFEEQLNLKKNHPRIVINGSSFNDS
jgi:hypothetical protein